MTSLYDFIISATGYLGIGVIVTSGLFMWDGRLSFIQGAVGIVVGMAMLFTASIVELRRDEEAADWFKEVLMSAYADSPSEVKENLQDR